MKAVIEQLADGNWHSGEALAQAAGGISRAAVWKQLQKAQDCGLEVQSLSGKGYRLAVPLQPLNPERIALEAGQSAQGIHIDVVEQTDSTNAQLMGLGDDAQPRVLFAEFQTGGRGRRGRQWISPYGSNLCLSMAWTYPEMPPNLGALSLAVGVAIARVLRAMGCDAVGLKWPNDLLADGRKLAGILIEHQSAANGASRVVVGLGLNVFMRDGQAESVSQPWIALDQLVAAIDRNRLAGQLVAALGACLRDFGAAGFAPFAADWRRLDAVAGGHAHIEAGGDRIACRVDGIAEDGALCVRLENGESQRFYAGEISLRPH